MLNAYAKHVFRMCFAKHVFLIAWWNIGFMCCISLFLSRIALHSLERENPHMNNTYSKYSNTNCVDGSDLVITRKASKWGSHMYKLIRFRLMENLFQYNILT